MWFNLAASGASDASDRDWWVKYRDLAAGLAKAIGATAFSRRLRCPKVRSLKTSASTSFSQFRSARDRRLAAIPRHPSLFPWTTPNSTMVLRKRGVHRYRKRPDWFNLRVRRAIGQ